MDASGQYVEMSADDLVVVENGVEQKVDTFHEAETPVSIVLALDASGSMRKSAEAVMTAARSFVESLRPQDELAVLFFSDGVLMAHDLSKKREPSLAAFDEYKTAGGTALYDAIGSALERLKRVETRRALVVMTDGRDENNPGTGPGSLRKLPDVIALTQEVDATILAIGLGSNLDRMGLEHLADISGGLAYFPLDALDLREQFVRTLENLRRRYVVGYTSTHVARDGSWRTVEIRSRSTNVRIRSRNGYFAPDK
jgi:VWFA-related protein